VFPLEFCTIITPIVSLFFSQEENTKTNTISVQNNIIVLKILFNIIVVSLYFSKYI